MLESDSCCVGRSLAPKTRIKWWNSPNSTGNPSVQESGWPSFLLQKLCLGAFPPLLPQDRPRLQSGHFLVCSSQTKQITKIYILNSQTTVDQPACLPSPLQRKKSWFIACLTNLSSVIIQRSVTNYFIMGILVHTLLCFVKIATLQHKVCICFPAGVKIKGFLFPPSHPHLRPLFCGSERVYLTLQWAL